MSLDAATLFSLAGETALVTGASGGLGQAIAEVLASAGARLVLSDHGEGWQDHLTPEVRTATDLAVPLDLADRDAVRRFAKALSEDGPLPRILVLNAGVQGPAGPMGEATEADWQRVLDVNLLSNQIITAGLLPAIAKAGGGSVIMMASIAGLRGNRAFGPYGVSKAAIMAMVRNIAVEWGPSGIRANALAPGLIRTPLAAALMSDTGFMARRLQATPLRRVGEPHEVAGTVLMLASRAGGFITGQTIVIDGGTLVSDGS